MKPGHCLLFAAFFILSVASLELTAQSELRVSRHYTFDDGLPTTPINWVLQDSRGFIWLATFNGLSRFDGYKLSSSQEEFHLKALTEPYVTVSRHTALIAQVRISFTA